MYCRSFEQDRVGGLELVLCQSKSWLAFYEARLGPVGQPRWRKNGLDGSIVKRVIFVCIEETNHCSACACW